MEIDLYQPCPCHAEKKIKFCCGKEVVTGLREVLNRHESRQTAAALDNLDRLISQHGPKDCLLLTRSQLQLQTGQIEEAEKSVRGFLERNPTHSVGLERLACALAGQQKTAEAWEALQDAMDNLPDSSVPVAFANGFRYVGMALMADGLLPAARRHALLANMLEQSDPARDQLTNTIESYARTLVLQRDFAIPKLADESAENPWNKRYLNAIRAQNRGQFRKAIQLIDRALAASPGELPLIRAAAAVASLFPDPNRLVAAHRAIARDPRFPLLERVDAEMLAQYFDRNSLGPQTETLVVTLNLNDFETLRERILSMDRLVEVEVPDPGDEREDSQPPPRGAWALLDRPALREVTADLQHSDVPCVLAQILVFGRQTDREARLEVIVNRNGQETAALDWLKSELAGLVSEGGEEIIGHRDAETDRISAAWHLPPALSRTQHERLTRDRQFHVARNLLADLPFSALGGRTLRQAAADPDSVVAAQAMVCSLELSNDARPWAEEWGAAVRAAVGLDPLPAWNAADGPPAGIPQILVRYLDPETVPTAVLFHRFQISAYLGDIRSVRRIVPELLKREDLGLTAETGDDARVRLHLAMAEISTDDGQCFEQIALARQLARKAGTPVGLILVREFEQCLLRSKFDRLRGILRELELHHMNDPRVREALTLVLANYGMISPDGQMMLPAEAAGEARPEQGVWTPESAGAATSKSAGGLWLPGQ